LLKAETASIRMSESKETYSLVPVEECAIHEAARIRFDYQVDGLTESIRAVGQVQPGKAVRKEAVDSDGVRYLVYIGCRRLIACRQASAKRFKALVVEAADEGRIQRELLTENTKRANLSALEELNLLARYSENDHSLDDLARDVGLSARLARSRVELAVAFQGKGLLETFYKLERVSGFRFTHRHIEKIAELEEERWLPAAVHAAEHMWKAQEIETLGRQTPLDNLVEALPAWGRQFVPLPVRPARAPERPTASQAFPPPQVTPEAGREFQGGPPRTTLYEHTGGEEQTDRFSRYLTVAGSAQFIVCPRCGSESAIQLPSFPPSVLLRPGRVEKGATTISLDKESIPLLMAVASVKCANEKCGTRLLVTVDESGDGRRLVGDGDAKSLLRGAIQVQDAGVGALVWDSKLEVWLKAQSVAEGEEPSYLAYDREARRWTIPVKLQLRRPR
jgi:ParB/RepB/Spo0J family partition protein